MATPTVTLRPVKQTLTAFLLGLTLAPLVGATPIYFFQLEPIDSVPRRGDTLVCLLHVITSDDYECANYTLAARFDQSDSTLSLSVDSILFAEPCVSRYAPARFVSDTLFITASTLVVTLTDSVYSEQPSRYRLSITDTAVVYESLPNPASDTSFIALPFRNHSWLLEEGWFRLRARIPETVSLLWDSFLALAEVRTVKPFRGINDNPARDERIRAAVRRDGTRYINEIRFYLGDSETIRTIIDGLVEFEELLLPFAYSRIDITTPDTMIVLHGRGDPTVDRSGSPDGLRFGR